MINNDLLGNRLTAIKNGEPIPQIDVNTNNTTSINSTKNINNSTSINGSINNIKSLIFEIIINVISTLLRGLIFGYACQSLFQTEWNFIGIFAIGTTISILIAEIKNIFTNRYIEKFKLWEEQK